MNKYFNIKFCFALVWFFIFVGCKQSKKNPKSISFLDDSYSILMPTSWSLRKDLNENADLQMGNSFKEAYCVILSDSKKDLEDNMTLKDHSNFTRSFLKKSLKDYQESEPKNFKVGEVLALRYQLSGSIDRLKIIYWHVTFETENHFHQMLLWSLPSKFSKNIVDFNKVIQSFNSLKKQDLTNH